MRPRLAIIGGGISGLAAAHRLRELQPDAQISLYESRPRLGGVIETTRRDGFLIESAADNFITTNPAAVQLCKRLGLEDELLPTNSQGCGAMVLRNGQLVPIPAGFLVMAPSRILPMLTTKALSPWGKLRAGLEYLVPAKRSDEDESLASFTCRRFGREMFERLVQPLVGGIYTADPQRLSLAATMPRFLSMEREHGSLVRAMLRNRKQRQASVHKGHGGARYSQFLTLRGGMSRLVEKLADSLPEESIHLRSSVRCVMPSEHGSWMIRVDGATPPWEEYDGVIVACPAPQASALLANCDRQLSDELSRIEYASCAVVSLAYHRGQIRHPLESFGFVVPLVENRLILSCSFSSLKYDGRAPDGMVLFRVFIGGACQGGLLRLPRRQLIELAEHELRELLQIRGKAALEQIAVQTRAMPQYHVGHCQRVQNIERCLQQHTSLAVAGNALNGVGVPGCIESGEAAAERVMQGVRAVHQQTAQLALN